MISVAGKSADLLRFSDFSKTKNIQSRGVIVVFSLFAKLEWFFSDADMLVFL